jgi:predicted alpha/beta superfamily hydrolase
MDDEGRKIYEALRLKGQRELVLCEMQVKDWDNLLTPWPVENCVKGRHFGGQAEELLEEIENRLLPYIRAAYPDVGKVYIAGYSLAGLFSMWALYESALFDGAVSCSGSLWYPGWMAYMEGHRLCKGARIYLSLGKNEEHTKHPFMKAVGTATRQQYAHLQKDPLAQETVLEWNEGGHFSDSTGRMVKGIEWMMGKG